MKTVQKSAKLANVCYDIRGPVLARARQMEDEGQRIMKLNIGNPAAFGFLAPDEMVQDVQAVSVDAMRAFHRRFYSAARSEFSAVGDLDAPAVTKALEAAFGDWRQPAAGPQPYERVPRPLVAAIRAPWGMDTALREAVARLRAEGHTVVCALPGHDHQVDEFHCDRELVPDAARPGAWTVRQL